MKALAKLWKSFWTPEINGLAMAVYRILFYSLGILWIERPRFNEGLYNQENWAPVGVFRIFDGPFLDYHELMYFWYAWMFFASLCALGIFFRISSVLAGISLIVVVGYDYNYGHVWHSFHVYLLTAILMCLTTATHYSFDSGFFKRSRFQSSWVNGFVLRLIMVHAIWIMMVNGTAKLYHSGLKWAFSENMAQHIFSVPLRSQIGDWILFNYPQVLSYLAAGVLLIQLTSWVSILGKYPAVIYFFLWSSFHIGVDILLPGHHGFYSQIIVYLAFPCFYFQKNIERILSKN